MAYIPKRHYPGTLLQARRNRGTKVRSLPSGGYPTNSSEDEQPMTAAMLAANIFGVYDIEGAEACDASSGEPLSSFYFTTDEPEQLEFDFRNRDELEEDLRNMIRRHERAMEKMGMYALRWHWLMEDVERHGQIEKMFKDLELCRKLCGGGERDLDNA